MIAYCWAFIELGMDFDLILLILNMVIHRSFTKPYFYDFTDTCGCDGDGSCVETILNNYHVTQGNSQRTEIVHKAATEMVKKHVMLRGK